MESNIVLGSNENGPSTSLEEISQEVTGKAGGVPEKRHSQPSVAQYLSELSLAAAAAKQS